MLFSLSDVLGDSVYRWGLDAFEPMIKISKNKQSKLQSKNTVFQNYDVTHAELFDDDSIKIPMCVYSTIGVIISKRMHLFKNMKNHLENMGLL